MRSDESERKETINLRPIGLTLFGLPFPILAGLIMVWPVNAGSSQSDTVQVLFGRWGMPVELALIMVVILSGALGSAVFAARSFAVHHGRGTFDTGWLWWYLIRFPVGIGIALIFYFVLRAGLFNGSLSNQRQVTESINPFGIAAISALAGMFARQTANKLEELFDNLFKTTGRPDARLRPLISDIEGPPFETNVKDAKLVIRGQNFRQETKVKFDGNLRKNTIVNSATELVVPLTSEDVSKSGQSVTIVVINADSELSDPKVVRLTN